MSTQNSESNVIPIHADETPVENDAVNDAVDSAADVTADDTAAPDNDNGNENDSAEEGDQDTLDNDDGEGGDTESDEENGESDKSDETVPEPDEEDIRRGMRLLEALLFASAEPLSERMLSNRLPEHLNTKTLLKNLQQDFAERGVNLVQVGNSWAFRTADDLSAILNVEAEVSRKMSRATIETMAIVAYHQPVTRAEIEEIRGVSLSKGTFDLLFEKNWIKPRGRRESPGRPMTWGTTDGFLDHFGLSRVTDLPGMDELRAAGLLESGPALNVYRDRGGIGEGTPESGDGETGGEGSDDIDPAALSPFAAKGEEDALPEVPENTESEEPLDPGIE